MCIFIFVIKDKQTDMENLELLLILNSEITYHAIDLKSMRPWGESEVESGGPGVALPVEHVKEQT